MNLQLLLIAVWASVAQCTELSPCPPGAKHVPKKNNIDIKKLKIKGCPQPPCTFYKGDYVDVETVSVMKFSTTQINYIVSIVTDLGPIDVDKGDGCQYVIDSCDDLKPGKEIRANVRTRLSEFYPVFDGILRIQILDDTNTPQYCSQLHAVLKEKPLFPLFKKN